MQSCSWEDLICIKTVVVLVCVFLAAGALAAPIHFQVDASNTTGPMITPLLNGLNVARWDHQMYPTTGTAGLQDCDTTAIQRLKDLGLGFLKYPGGNDADSYIWNSPDNKPHDMDTDEYLDLQKRCGVPGFFTVNFTQPPQLAADWVNYIREKTEKSDAVPLWEVGDEVWGPWAKSHTSGANYARKFREFADAMHAVDPRLQLAANLHLADPDTTWTREALEGLGDSFSVVTTTFFPLSPPSENDEALFRAPDKYRHFFLRLKSFVTRERHGKPLPKFCLVGFNSTSSHPGPQTTEMANAVFMAQMYGALAETGTDMSCWWAFHNEWKPRNGDFGIVTSTPENRPYYTYYVLKLLAHNFLGRVIAAERSGSMEFYATRQDGGEITLMLINTSQAKPCDAEIEVTAVPAAEKAPFKVRSVDVVSSSTAETQRSTAPQAASLLPDQHGSSILKFNSLPAYAVGIVTLK